MDSCYILLERVFISEEFGIKTVEVVAGAEEQQDRTYGKGTLSKIALSCHFDMTEKNATRRV